ncbi:MAG: DoxX family protein [Candidatus Omnitrophica bacterium]|nr:DoxX family protein [Candidatus Omnitrophota bacterium]
MAFILLLIRIFIGGVFLYSGWSKLMTPIENFTAVLEGYQFLKPVLITPVAFFVPWLELIFGAFLALGFLTRASASVIGTFLAVFIFLLSRSLLLHLPISECGCFGSGITLAPWQALALDLGLFIASLILLWRCPKLLSLDERLNR